MAFTYTAGSTSALHRVRLELGDTDTATALFQDEEILVKLGDRADNVLLAAADLCDILARRFGRAYDFETDNQSFKRSQMSAAYRALAAELRDRASGLATVSTTRVDGYSQDIDNQSVLEEAPSSRGRYRRLDDAPF